jgi:small-conductance mechanosensitive channel
MKALTPLEREEFFHPWKDVVPRMAAYGAQGTVDTMSRDWVIDKIAIGITYDSDLNLAKKLTKQIGQDLANIPEFAPPIIEPSKMQGVDALGDFAAQIRASSS